MAARSHDSQPVSPWSLCSPTSTQSYRVAALRAALIAAVLIGVLVVIVWW